MDKEKVSYTIIMEQTPNPETIKFITNRTLLPAGKVLEFDDNKNTKVSPLVQSLFSFPFIKKVLLAENYISITKQSFVSWDDVLLELRDYIYQYLNENKTVIDMELINEYLVSANSGANTKEGHRSSIEAVAVKHNVVQSEIEQKIVDILNEYIMPAVSQDGGFITFESYQEGVVYLKLRGACSGCPSSMYTLKAGIEALLKKMLPDLVKEVRSENVL